jgi:hypothetical protein
MIVMVHPSGIPDAIVRKVAFESIDPRTSALVVLDHRAV